MDDLTSVLTRVERERVEALTSPLAIQTFLDETPYSPEPVNRCPAAVVRDNLAHCLDGAMFAAAALRRLGYPPLLVDLLPEPELDDDHLLAVFRRGSYWGAVAKSNFTGLRYREPVYRSLRELALSYFEFYFNVDGLRTLRAYTRPLNLDDLSHYLWETTNAGADVVEQRLYGLRPIRLLGRDLANGLSPVDPLTYRAGLLVANPDGLFKPKP